MSSSDEDRIDITNLLRTCASQCLSYSHPFTPNHDDEPLPSPDVEDVSQLGGLLQVTSLENKCKGDNPTQAASSTGGNPVNLRDAMSALELGDKRMDCCEIPIQPCMSPGIDETPSDYSSMYDRITYPPRIAPKNISDGTPLEAPRTSNSTTHSKNSVPKSPCPSLLPYWNTLSLSPDSSTSLLPLMLLQFTSLEAYIGTNSGGSNAAETLFCMMWHHEGILRDMAERLDAISEVEGETGETEEVKVAQWALFAGSLGTVRIAEMVRSIVRDADIYEEEDFGVEWEWGSFKLSNKEGGEIDQSNLNRTDPTKSTFGFSEEGRLVNEVWSVAISKLERYKSALADTDMASTIQAVILLLQAQQSFYVTIQILYNLNDQNVVNFTELATEFSRKTVRLLKQFQGCTSIERYVNHALIGSDGRLCEVSWLSSPDKNHECTMFLGASFDPYVNRRLLGNAPIRKARFNPINNGIDSMSNLASELEWSVCEVLLNGNTFGRITRMLSNNSLRGRGGAVPTPSKSDGEASPQVGINILCRSLMLLNLYFDEKLLGQYDFVDIIGENNYLFDVSLLPKCYRRCPRSSFCEWYNGTKGSFDVQNGCHSLRILSVNVLTQLGSHSMSY